MEVNSKYQVFWKRYWANSIDIIVIGILLVVSVVMLGQSTLVSFIFCVIIWLSYRILFHRLTGQTIGKRVTNIIVLDMDEKQLLSKLQCIKREIPTIIIALISSYLLYQHSLHPKYEYEDIPRLMDSANFQTDTTYSIGRVYRLRNAIEKVQSQQNAPSDIIKYSGLILAGIVCLSMLSNTKLRGLHDMIAKSVVVRKEIWDKENEEK